MTKHYYLFIPLLIIAATPRCHAMEGTLKASPSNSSATIKIDGPYDIICFPNNIVAISGTKGCDLYNFSTYTHLIQLDTTPHPTINAHPNKTMLALLNNHAMPDHLAVYDMATQTKIWHKKTDNFIVSSATFNPFNTTIITRYFGASLIQSFNYNDNTDPQNLMCGVSIAGISTFHPTQQKCLIFDHNTVSTLNFDNHPYRKRKQEIFHTNKKIKDCKYSPDGSLIAINSYDGELMISDTETKSHKDLNNKQQYCSMVFIPNSFIIATLSDCHDTLCYWNTKNKQLIAATTLDTLSSSYKNDKFKPKCPRTSCMDFSCDGTQLIIACPLTDECLVRDVPFDALYQPGTKDKCIFTYLMLQHYFHDETRLPLDIRHLLIKYLLATSKYSLINY